MKANELMIGDWVHNETHLFGVPYGEDIQVMNVYDGLINYVVGELGFITGYKLNECHPIPLTPEILEKNGFVFNSCGRRYWYEGFGLALDYGARSKELYLRLFRINRHVHIHYVHELQHALRLCGLHDLADNFIV